MGHGSEKGTRGEEQGKKRDNRLEGRRGKAKKGNGRKSEICVNGAERGKERVERKRKEENGIKGYDMICNFNPMIRIS